MELILAKVLILLALLLDGLFFGHLSLMIKTTGYKFMLNVKDFGSFTAIQSH
jgi:hypothetical protein